MNLIPLFERQSDKQTHTQRKGERESVCARAPGVSETISNESTVSTGHTNLIALFEVDCYARHLARAKPAASPSTTAAASSAARASAACALIARVLAGFAAVCAKGSKMGRWSARESSRS